MLQLRLPLPRFVSAGELFSGSGSLGALRALDAAKAAVLVSPSVLRQHADVIERSVGADVVKLISMPRGEPSVTSLAPVLRELEEFQPDWIIAIGGGSVIDGAKVAWVLYEHPAVDRERLLLAGGIPTLRGKAKFAAVPTTAGTGSEVSSSALLIDEATGRKHALASPELLPDVAVLDPRLVVGSPAAVIAHAGLDALAHAVESYVSRLENPLADLLAEKATAEIFQALPTLLRDSVDEASCLRMMNASLLAGWVQNQKIPGIGHAIAHQLGSLGIAHGAATGRLLASAMRYNCGDETIRVKYDALAVSLQLADADELIAEVDELVNSVGCASLPSELHETGDDIIAGAQEDPCARYNPREVTADAVAEVLEGAQ
ncbi:iron-containing alcohol dehydrogenase [Cerasicoccus maritimus]|uniref:iron-containing alcohol dehydrogenase n=1 Tax=Cerasicoccus maritimus TaxID=490089 RepID=UPI0028527D3F|nr:iron-containing alcohol dehydrogenase [Cerasicoccus maritimus]